MSRLPRRRLVLMRHAKSDWKTGAATDHARPLNARGRSDAPRMGTWLAQHGWEPQLVVLSDSVRTTETWERLRASLPGSPAVMPSHLLYHAGLQALLAHSASWPADVETVLALGHNPGWEDAQATLSGSFQSMTTANIALLVGAGESWKQALSRRWTRWALVRPKEL